MEQSLTFVTQVGKDGVLRVRVPKSLGSRRVRITVSAEPAQPDSSTFARLLAFDSEGMWPEAEQEGEGFARALRERVWQRS